MISRRKAIKTFGAAVAGGGAFLHFAGKAEAAEAEEAAEVPLWRRPAREPATDYPRVKTPNGITLDYRVIEGVRVYHLTAEPVRHQFAPGLEANCWGYNGRVHGPTIEAVEGDRVRIYVTNRLPASTSIHWHGMVVPSGMDGVGGLSHPSIRPGETYRYEFTINHHGTFQYHSHHDEMTQMAMGLTGLFVVHPREPEEDPPDHQFGILLHEWRIKAGTARPDPLEMVDFDVLTMNAKVFPATAPMVVRTGQRVRIRFGNLSAMSHHPIHIHGHHFWITGTDAGPIPASARTADSTVLVPVGTTRDIDFIADNPGDWALHCHMTHHIMNQMGHGVPNLIGLDPGDFDERMQKLIPGYMTMGHKGMEDHGLHVEEGHMRVPRNSIPMVGMQGPRGYVTMGGMSTLIKVRDGITTFEDPGWYENPEGTEAKRATREELERDGIDAPPPPKEPEGEPPHHEHHGHD